MGLFDNDPLPSVVEAYRRITGRDPHVVGKRRGADLWVPCVSTANHTHGDANPSLRINVDKDVWTCDPCRALDPDCGGMSTALVVHAGIARDLSEASKWLCPPEEVQRARQAPPPPMEQQRLVAEYNYATVSGPMLYQVRRFEWDIPVAPGEPPQKGKTFSQRRLVSVDAEGNVHWDNRLGDVQRVPYRYGELVYVASELGQTVYVVEGEKDCDRMNSVGLFATTNAGGAGWKWTLDFLECFRGVPSVVVIGDNDDAGRAAARARADALSQVCGMVRLVESIPGIKPKGDVSDWFDDHPDAGADEFRAMLAPVAKVVGAELDDGSLTPLRFDVLHARVLATQNVIVPAVPFAIPLFDKHIGGMQEGRVSVLAGRPGQGKTAVGIYIALAAALKQHRVVVLSLEMGQVQWHDRASAAHQGRTVLAYRDAKRAEDPIDLEWYVRHNLFVTGGSATATLDRIDELAALLQPKLLIVDHLRHVKGWMASGRQRADLAASELMYAFPELARKRKTHVLLLHQLNRQAGNVPTLEDLRDAGAVEEVADNVVLIDRPYKTHRGIRPTDGTKDDDVIHVHLAKSREGAEVFGHMAWDGPTMTPRPWLEGEYERFTRCCAK